MLGGSFEGIVDANLLPWAQLAWGAGGGQRDTAAAASLVQRLDWQEMAFTLPGMQSQPLHVCSRAVVCGLGRVMLSVIHFWSFGCGRASMTRNRGTHVCTQKYDTCCTAWQCHCCMTFTAAVPATVDFHGGLEPAALFKQREQQLATRGRNQGRWSAMQLLLLQASWGRGPCSLSQRWQGQC